jgi:hypothetical protein
MGGFLQDKEETGSMQAMSLYHIKLRGQVDERAFEATSPLRIRVDHINEEATLLTVDTDQSGLIGVLRYLHQQGFVLLSAYRSEA